MKNKIIGFLIVIITIPSYGQKKQLIGQKLPNPSIEILLQASHSSLNSWEPLEGKWVLLEFWTTWCAPCIKKLPEFNQMVKEMENENIEFISISPEKKSTIEKFLKRKSISGWIGVDADNDFLKALSIKSYPTTILVNPKGIIEAYIPTKNLNKKTLSNFINSKRINQSTKVNSNKKISFNENSAGVVKKVIKPSGEKNISLNKGSKDVKKSKPLYSIEIKKTDNKFGFTMKGKKNGILRSTSITLLDLISYAYNMSNHLIFGNKELLVQKYDVNIKLPKGDTELFEKMLQKSIENKLRFKIVKEKRNVLNYEMLAPNRVSKNLFIVQDKSRTRSNASNDDGIIGVSNSTLDYLVKVLEQTLNAEVLDKTNLKDRYDYNLYWNPNLPNSIIKALKKQLGLELKIKKTNSQVLLVKKEVNN